MVRAVALENLGLTSCSVQGLWIDGSPDVRVASSSVVIGAGERRLIDVEYSPPPPRAPTAFPPAFLGELGGGLGALGAAEGAAIDGCLFISPEQWDFGTVAPSCGARVQSFGVGNRCTGATSEVVISNVEVNGSVALSLDGSPPQRIAPSTFEPNVMRVRFDPTSASVHPGTLEVEVQVTGGTRKLRVPLRGKADPGGRQRDRFVMPSSADALWVQAAGGGSGRPAVGALHARRGILALARSRNASVRVGAVRAKRRRPPWSAPGGRWVQVALPRFAQPAQLAALIDAGPASFNAVEAFTAPGLAALSGPGITGFNAGFLRRGASLNVVSLGNAGEGSTQPMSVLLPQLSALKGTQRPEWLSWSAVGPFGPVTSGCTYDEASPNSFQRTVAQQLGGVTAEHCELLAESAAVRVFRRAHPVRCARVVACGCRSRWARSPTSPSVGCRCRSRARTWSATGPTTSPGAR